MICKVHVNVNSRASALISVLACGRKMMAVFRHRIICLVSCISCFTSLLKNSKTYFRHYPYFKFQLDKSKQKQFYKMRYQELKNILNTSRRIIFFEGDILYDMIYHFNRWKVGFDNSTSVRTLILRIHTTNFIYFVLMSQSPRVIIQLRYRYNVAVRTNHKIPLLKYLQDNP